MKSSPGEIAAPGTISITPVAATKTMAAPAATIPVATSSRRGLGKRDRSKNSASAQIINPVGIRTDGCIPVATITDALTTQAVPAVISSIPGTRPVTALMPKEYALRQAGHGVPPGPAAHFPVRPPKARMFHVPTVSVPTRRLAPVLAGMTTSRAVRRSRSSVTAAGGRPIVPPCRQMPGVMQADAPDRGALRTTLSRPHPPTVRWRSNAGLHRVIQDRRPPPLLPRRQPGPEETAGAIGAVP